MRKRNRFSTKYLTGRKKTWVGIICGVVPQNLKIEFVTFIRVLAKAEFTNPIPQKIRRTKKYCGIPQNKGHEFHNIFKFCGTTPQIIPTHVFFRPVKYFVENRFRFRKSTSTSDSTNKIRTFFVKFRFVNSAFANTLFHSTFKFCGTSPQIIPTHVSSRLVKYFVENRFRFRKSTSASDFTNKIRSFFVKFGIHKAESTNLCEFRFRKHSSSVPRTQYVFTVTGIRLKQYFDHHTV